MAQNDYLITPNTDIYLIKCPLEIDSLNQLDFANTTAQYNYFQSLPKILMDDATYMRKDGRLYFEGSYDELVGYNYCMYRNNSYTNKWFYAYATDMRYESNNSISVVLSTDVFQTWMFEHHVNASFIERSHVPKSSDTLGAYTYPEGLETGDYKIYAHLSDSTTKPDCIVVGCTIDTETSTQAQLNYYSGMYNGLFAGCGYYRFDSFGQLVSWLNAIRYAHDSIVTMFMYPKSLAPLMSGSNNKVATSEIPIYKYYGISRITSLDGYVPKNTKCLVYPYCYVVLSNGMGTSGIYRQEVWNLTSVHDEYTDIDNEMVLLAESVLCPGGSVRLVPINYNGTYENFDEGFSLGKYPQLSWQVDLYTNWEVQNGVNIFGTPLTATQFGYTKYGLQLGNSLLSGNIEGAGTPLSGIFNTMQEQYRHSMVPPTIGGSLNSGDVSALNGAMALHMQRCGIKREYAEKIDNYFEMFGYKINNVEVPNTKSRSKWNYIKTIDVNITGDIPQDDMQKLKALYNNGFTIWHDSTHFLDYTQNNT